MATNNNAKRDSIRRGSFADHAAEFPELWERERDGLSGYALSRGDQEDWREALPSARTPIVLPRLFHNHHYELRDDGLMHCVQFGDEKRRCLVPTIPACIIPPPVQVCGIDDCEIAPERWCPVCGCVFCREDWPAHDEAEQDAREKGR